MTHGFSTTGLIVRQLQQVKRLTKGGGSWLGWNSTFPFSPSHSSLPIWRFFPEKLFHSRGEKKKRREIMNKKENASKDEKEIDFIFFLLQEEKVTKLTKGTTCFPSFFFLFFLLFIYLLIYFRDLQLVVVFQNRSRGKKDLAIPARDMTVPPISGTLRQLRKRRHDLNKCSGLSSFLFFFFHYYYLFLVRNFFFIHYVLAAFFFFTFPVTERNCVTLNFFVINRTFIL